MPRRFEKLDGMLGRLLFRAVGLVCALVALICAFTVHWHLTNWNPDYSLVPAILFGLAAIAAASAVPYCFSRKRTFANALDAMEGGVGDRPRPPNG
jgi:uncharacterized membrane protein